MENVQVERLDHLGIISGVTHIEQVKFPIFKFCNMLFLIALRKLFLKDDFYEGALSL